MQRRSAILSIGAMVLGARTAGVAAIGHGRSGLQQATGEAAARVVVHTANRRPLRSSNSLCRQVSGRLQGHQPASPALIQAAADACRRECGQLPGSLKSAELAASVDEFQMLAERLIGSYAA